METRTLKLTHAEIEMIKNALQYVADKILDNYKGIIDLEKSDLQNRSTKENEYPFNRYKKYSDLAGDIADSKKDI